MNVAIKLKNKSEIIKILTGVISLALQKNQMLSVLNTVLDINTRNM
jgi:uncharacterized membrane protein